MLQPARTKYRKQQKGRNKGPATRGTKVAFGDYGLKATTHGHLTADNDLDTEAVEESDDFPGRGHGVDSIELTRPNALRNHALEGATPLTVSLAMQRRELRFVSSAGPVLEPEAPVAKRLRFVGKGCLDEELKPITSTTLGLCGTEVAIGELL